MVKRKHEPQSLARAMCVLAVYYKAQAQRIWNREFKLWTFLQGTESRVAIVFPETCVMSHQSISRQAKLRYVMSSKRVIPWPHITGVPSAKTKYRVHAFTHSIYLKTFYIIITFHINNIRICEL